MRDLPETVLRAGFDALSERAKLVSAARLQNGDRGGCLAVCSVEKIGAGLPLYLSLPAFELSKSTDLMTTSELFGLTTALEPRRGGQPNYSDLAIDMCLTLGLVFKQRLRQSQGLMRSLARLLGGIEIAG